MSRIERDSHSFRSFVTHSRPPHVVFLTRKNYLEYVEYAAAPNQNVFGRAALTMKPTGIKRVSPGVLSRACHLSANQKEKKETT